MKKLLLATTAVALSAGMASAQGVSLSGDARMGVFYDGSDAVSQQRARVAFTLSGETDGGLAFGGFFRAVGGAANTGAEVFVSGDFGTLTFGNVDNALIATTFNAPHLGVLENAAGSRRTAIGSADILYQYSIDGFSFAASVDGIEDAKDTYSVAAAYDFGDFAIAAGYERSAAVAPVQSLGIVDGEPAIVTSAAVPANTHMLISARGSFDDLSVMAYAGRNKAKDNQFGGAISYKMDAATITVRGKRDFAGNNHMGAGVTYGLGGGATIGGSVNKVKGADATADFGLSFSF